MPTPACITPLRRLVCLLPLLLASGSVMAQYQWRDENNRMVFSDKAPPPHIDPAKVMRSDPGRLRVVTASPSASSDRPDANPGRGAPAASGAAANANRATAPLSLADRQLDAKRKAQEKADADRKKKEQADDEARIARACEDMRTEVRTLETGMRVARVNAQGEREILSDEDRNKRVETVKRDMREHCKQG